MNILTHNGKVTLRNPITGNHRTFQIKTAQGGKLKGKRIISALFGPDNENDYKGFGFVEDKIILWKWAQTDYFKAIARLLLNPKGVEVHFEGRCIRCNRLLTHPDSIVKGIGPECEKKC